MSQVIAMPALSDTMSNGRLVKWLKTPGERISKGDIIAEVETDKAVMEVEAFQDGYLSGPLVAEGTEALVGQTIGYIADEIPSRAGKAADAPPSSVSGNAAAVPAAERAPVSAVLAASKTPHRTSPRMAAYRPALPFNADSAAKEIPSVLQAALEAGPPRRLERASSMREAVARNMSASAATPSFRVSAVLPLVPLLDAAQQHHYALSLVLARACALTIVAHPLFNAVHTPGGLVRRDRVDIGIALEQGDGLITPVLRDAAGQTFSALAEQWGMLRQKAQSRRLIPAEYSGATFYLSDLGVFPIVRTFDSIIPVGAAAILSVAAAGPQGAFCTLTCDHRVVFGADAARFLETLDRYLRDPAKLFAEQIEQ